MKLIDVDCRQITLSGITLNASFTLSNPHEILAVMFELQAKPSYFQIEPERGMILQGQKKFIKIRLQPQLRSQAKRIEKQDNALAIRATYYCEYNRKLLEKNNLKGWNQISKQYCEDHLPLRLSFEEEIQKLKNTVKRGNSLKEFPKQNSFEKFRDSSIKRAKDPKLNQDLEFLFRNQDYARQKISKHHKNKQRSRQYSPIPQMIESKQIKVSHPNEDQMEKEKRISLLSNPAVKNSRGRGMQLVILAVIAALCLVAGETVGVLFKR